MYENDTAVKQMKKTFNAMVEEDYEELRNIPSYCKLKKVPDLVGEYIDIESYRGTREELKSEIRSYMKKEYLKYCDWCNLYKQKTVKVAEQRKK